MDRRPSTEQKELIAGFVESIKVTRDTAYMAYYDSSQAELIDLSKGLETKSNGIENDDRGAEPSRSLVRPSGNLVDQAKVCTNRPKLLDSFEFTFNINVINQEILRNLYLNEGLSASQIGRKLNASKTHVLKKLREMGIRKDPIERKFHPKNYRHHNPPYGYQIKNGTLKEHQSEIKISKLVVNLRTQEKMSFSAIAEKLKTIGIKNRSGQVSWHHSTVSQIFKRWNEKLGKKETGK